MLAVTLFHGGMNHWGRLVVLHPSETGDTVSAVVLTGGQALLAVGLLVVFGPTSLTRGRSESAADSAS